MCLLCDRRAEVIDTRSVYEGTVIYRRRACPNGHRFTTRETYAEVWSGEWATPMKFYPSSQRTAGVA